MIELKDFQGTPIKAGQNVLVHSKRYGFQKAKVTRLRTEDTQWAGSPVRSYASARVEYTAGTRKGWDGVERGITRKAHFGTYDGGNINSIMVIP